MSLVSFVNIEHNDMKSAIRNALALIGYQFQSDAKNIVIKPNMCYYWDSSTGQTTDPRFVGALIDIIRDSASSTANISLVESDASAMKCKHAFKFLGYEKLAKEYSVNLVNLSEDETKPIEIKVNNKSFHFDIPFTILEADLRINVTKIKYSLDKIKITCALKNIYGCNPYPKKFRYHCILDETIVALNKAMPFDLCLIDGNVAFGGQASKLGLVMGGKDAVAIDAAASRIAGVNPKSVGYLRLAQKEGLGKTQFVVKGQPISYYERNYPRKNIKKKLMSKAYNLVILLGLASKLGLE